MWWLLVVAGVAWMPVCFWLNTRRHPTTWGRASSARPPRPARPARRSPPAPRPPAPPSSAPFDGERLAGDRPSGEHPARGWSEADPPFADWPLAGGSEAWPAPGDRGPHPAAPPDVSVSIGDEAQAWLDRQH